MGASARIYEQEPVIEVTVKDCFEEWLKYKEKQMSVRNSTLQLYRQQIKKQIEPTLGGIVVSDLSTEILEQFFAQKQELGKLDQSGGLSRSVMSLLHYLLHSLQEFAQQKGYRTQPAASKRSQTRKESAAQIRMLSREEQQRLESVLYKKLEDQEHACLYMGIFFALYTGLRVGELGGLEWRDFNLKTKEVLVRRTLQRIRVHPQEKAMKKTSLCIEDLGGEAGRNAERSIPLSEGLLQMLRRHCKNDAGEQFSEKEENWSLQSGEGAGKSKVLHIARAENPAVFQSEGKRIEARNFQYHLKRVLAEAELEPMNYQMLRHTFAARCIEAGMDLKYLSELMGLRNAGVTLKIYEQVCGQERRARSYLDLPSCGGKR